MQVDKKNKKNKKIVQKIYTVFAGQNGCCEGLQRVEKIIKKKKKGHTWPAALYCYDGDRDDPPGH